MQPSLLLGANLSGLYARSCFPQHSIYFLQQRSQFLIFCRIPRPGLPRLSPTTFPGTNSFETWLLTLVPRMGQMHDPVSGGQLREKHSLTLASPAGEDGQTLAPPGPVALTPEPLCERFRFLNTRENTSPGARHPLGKELEPRDLGGDGERSRLQAGKAIRASKPGSAAQRRRCFPGAVERQPQVFSQPCAGH